MKIYEYAIVYQPKPDTEDKTDVAAILVQPTVVLCNNEREAMMRAARAIPDDYLERMDQLEVAVRHF